MIRETGAGGVVEGPSSRQLPAVVSERLPEGLRSDERYRSVLLTLAGCGGTCSLSSLTRALVEEGGWPRDADSGRDPYRATHLALVRQYVPVLTEFDVLDYDEEFGVLTLAGAESVSAEAEEY